MVVSNNSRKSPVPAVRPILPATWRPSSPVISIMWSELSLTEFSTLARINMFVSLSRRLRLGYIAPGRALLVFCHALVGKQYRWRCTPDDQACVARLLDEVQAIELARLNHQPFAANVVSIREVSHA